MITETKTKNCPMRLFNILLDIGEKMKMKKKVTMLGMFALIFSLTTYLFAFDVSSERTTEDAIFHGESVADGQEIFPDGWTIPKGNFIESTESKERGTIEYVGSTMWTGMSDVFVAGDSIWCSFNDGLRLIDISDISNPEFLSKVYTPFYTLKQGQIMGSNDILIEGDYAYIGDHEGVRIVNINNMELIFTYSLTRAHTLYLSGTLLYVADGTGLWVLDVSNPAVTHSVGFYEKAGAVGLDIVGNYAYVSDTGGTGLTILDISTPESPTFVSDYTTPGYGNEVIVANGCAFIADHANGLEIVDVSNPLIPVFNSNVAVSGAVSHVEAIDSQYVVISASAPSSIEVIDVSDPDNPFIATSYGGSGNLFMGGNRLFIVSYYSISIQDVTDPLSFLSLRSIDLEIYYSRQVRVSGNLAYIADQGDFFNSGLDIVDISDPYTPINRGNYSLEFPTNIKGLDAKGDYAYALERFSKTVKIIDVSDPDLPVPAGEYLTTVFGEDIFVGDPYTYLLIDKDLQIVDLQDPSNPSLVSSITLGTETLKKLSVDNGYAFIGDNIGDVWIVDVSNGLIPQMVSTFNTAAATKGIFTVGNSLYVVSKEQLQVVDISNINSPVIVGSYSDGDLSSYSNIYVNGGYAYIVNLIGGFLKIDVSDPTNPFREEFFQTSGWCRGLASANDYLYVTTDYSFQILKDESIQSIVGDFNSDGYVDAADLQLLGDNWHFIDTDPGWDALYDLVPDGIIDAADLQIFGDHWHEGTPPKSGEGGKDGKGPNEFAGIVFDLDAVTTGNQNLTSIPSQPVGTMIRLDVYCTGVSNLDTYEFEVIYDAAELAYISSSATNPITFEPNILTTNGGTALGWMVDSSTPGVLSIAYTLAGTDTAQAPEGEGLIADIVFQALVNTHGTLSFGDVYYYDSYGVVDLITDTGTATLPVELSSFNAIYNTVSGFVSLCWATASETDVNGFNIYRNTEDSFVEAEKINIDLIAGSGTTTETTEYSFTDETADPYYTTYYYWLEVINFGGTNDKFGPFKYIPIDVNHDGELGIITSTLSSCYPNPARIGNEIKFNFRVGGLEGTARNVELKVYNILGKLVAEIVNGERLVNDYTETWKPENLSNGVYFYQLKTENYSEVKKMLIQ